MLIKMIHLWIRTSLLLPDTMHNEYCKPYDKCSITLSIINFRSIINKTGEFLFFLQERKPKIIIGSEMWLSNDITDNEIIPNEFNYTIYRKDRVSGYGGIMKAT